VGGSKSLILGRGNIKEGNNTMKPYRTLLERAKHMRSNQTDHEKIIWQILRSQRFQQLKFRRQQPIGRYIVDFICFSPKIIIECDGGQHATATQYDLKRDNYLARQGFRVLRFWNNEILFNRDGVMSAIWHACFDSPSPKSKISTLPPGESMG
jgi:very-short-patch-repair endonuclease